MPQSVKQLAVFLKEILLGKKKAVCVIKDTFSVERGVSSAFSMDAITTAYIRL